MKYFAIIMILLASMPGIAAGAQEITRPAPLQPGDRIAIISPASWPEREYVEGGMEVLRQWGFVPVLGKNAMNQQGNYAGDINERRTDLEWAFAADSIKAIMCTRGGYGSIQELLVANNALIKQNPKWLIGYSDITAVHGAMVRQGVMSLHAHMLEHLNRSGGTHECDSLLRDILNGRLPTYELAPEQFNQYGTATGVLVGGNLSLVTSIAGSPFDMLALPNDLVLFIEDIDENLEHLNRMFYQLVARGVIARVKGVILGDFSGYRPTADFNTAEEMFHSILKNYNIPVCYKFPCGHTERNFPMIQGATVQLHVGEQGTTLKWMY
ncbi:MAG: LD-carboxypeptidase [Muribaculaceae bacterium]